MHKIYVTWNDVFEHLKSVDSPEEIVYGVPKGGMVAAAFLQKARVTCDPNEATVILDDLIDSGKTKQFYQSKFPDTPFTALIDKRTPTLKGAWIVLPWEQDHPGGEENIQDNLTRILQYVGEDPVREGLVDTPKRIVKSWDTLFGGYHQDPNDLLTHFDAESYDQIILLKNTEMYSMCEHHMLPFVGKAHIAYIPCGRVIGVSKLARLLDIYSRRLQIQERIGEQITTFLMDASGLGAKAAACIIEAQHLCMRMRGVSKEGSVMVTSSLKGIFRYSTIQGSNARAELMRLIRP